MGRPQGGAGASREPAAAQQHRLHTPHTGKAAIKCMSVKQTHGTYYM